MVVVKVRGVRQLFILYLQSGSKEQTRCGAALRNLMAGPGFTSKPAPSYEPNVQTQEPVQLISH